MKNNILFYKAISKSIEKYAMNASYKASQFKIYFCLPLGSSI